MKEGLLLIDKPSGITSHDVVDVVRRKLKIRKVGHAGTLDPLATGLMVVLVGKATKLFQSFSGLDKKYKATLKLGGVTSTGDKEGRMIEENSDYKNITVPDIEEAFAKFRGEILQVPPQVSAIRYKGKRLYQLARKGEYVDVPPRKIKIYSLEIEDIRIPQIDFFVHCSKGTYVRKLSCDIGEVLGCGAYILGIRRTQIGGFRLENAVSLDKVNENHILEQTTLL